MLNQEKKVKYELGIRVTKNRASLFVDGEHHLKEMLRTILPGKISHLAFINFNNKKFLKIET